MESDRPSVIVRVVASESLAWSEQLARRLGVPLGNDGPVPGRFELYFSQGRLWVCEPGSGDKPFCVDFLAPSIQRRVLRPRHRGELLSRIFKGKPEQEYRVLDLTAGFCTDSLVLAALGFQVIALERSAIIYELCQDALRRAAREPGLAAVAERIRLLPGDSFKFLKEEKGSHGYGGIYLDPMYPQRKYQAESRKSAKLLRRIVGVDSDSAALLELALGMNASRVVVKRPAKARPLLREPDFAVKGSAVRFDVYLTGAAVR